MPKVRDSSGTMGTISFPIFLSRASAVSMRTNAIVVDMSRSPEPLSSASKVESGGTSMRGLAALRAGR